jgi:hypothetical protein
VADLGPAPIQTNPIGLIQLLGLRNSGINPSPLSEQLASVIDLFPFYARNATPRGSDLISVTAGGTVGSTFNVVPAGKTWLVTSISIQSAVSGAVPFKFPIIGVRDANQIIRRHWAGTFAGVTGDSSIIPVPIDPFFMDAGWQVFGSAATQAGGAYSAFSLSYQMDVLEF